MAWVGVSHSGHVVWMIAEVRDPTFALETRAKYNPG
jgi:hypothetical protein